MAGIIKFSEVSRALRYLYPRPAINKKAMARYKEIMAEIALYKPQDVSSEEELVVFLERPYEWRSGNGKKWEVHDKKGEEYYGVSMVKTNGKDKQHWAIEFTRWEKSSSWKISEDTLKHYHPAEILAHFLREITFCGYTQAPIQKKIKALNKIGEKILKRESNKK